VVAKALEVSEMVEEETQEAWKAAAGSWAAVAGEVEQRGEEESVEAAPEVDEWVVATVVVAITVAAMLAWVAEMRAVGRTVAAGKGEELKVAGGMAPASLAAVGKAVASEVVAVKGTVEKVEWVKEVGVLVAGKEVMAKVGAVTVAC